MFVIEKEKQQVDINGNLLDNNLLTKNKLWEK